MIKLRTIFAATLILAATGCSQSASDKPLDGEAIYKKSCINCHGADLAGGGPNISVKNLKDKFTEEDIIRIINRGQGMMPGGLVSEEDAKVLTTWLMEQ